MRQSGLAVEIWQAREAIDDHIRSYRDVHEHGSGNAKDQAPIAIATLQGLRMDLFGDILAEREGP